MLLQDRPRLIVCFHDQFDPASGGTSDMALRGLIRQVPVWLVPGEDPTVGRWLSLELFPRQRASRTRRELDTFPSLGRRRQGWPRDPASRGPSRQASAAEDEVLHRSRDARTEGT
jgi:hypothetical protein